MREQLVVYACAIVLAMLIGTCAWRAKQYQACRDLGFSKFYCVQHAL